MAAYNITLSNGSTIVTIPEGVIYNTYSVPLIGQNTTAYGDDVATAFLRGLENFAYSTPPDTNPNIPGSVKLTGQLWYDTGNAELNVWNGSNWITLLTAAAGLSDIAGDVTPSVDSTYDIGSTSLRWAQMWADDIHFGGTLTAESGSTVSVGGTFTADGSSTVTLSGTNSIDGATMTDRLTLVAASGGTASLRIPQGTSTSTTTGDLWLETDGVHVVINGSEETLLYGSVGGVTSFNGRGGAVVPLIGDYSSFYTVKDGSSGTQTISSGAGWTFNNRPAFNGGTSGATAPFTVDSTFVVTNLNADQLDGQEGSYYAVDAQVVKVTGSQNIAGAKTFTDTVVIDQSSGNALQLLGTNTAGANQVYMTFRNSSNSEVFFIGDDSASDNFRFDGSVSGNISYTYNADDRVKFDSAGVELYTGSPEIAFETVDPGAVTGTTSKASVYDTTGTRRNIGFNETPSVTIASATYIMSEDDIGKHLTRTGTSSVAVRLDNALTQIPVGGSFMVHNDNSTGTLTVTEGSGASLEWVDGSGSAPLTGTRTIAYNSIATIRKKSSSVYQIWGNGIS